MCVDFVLPAQIIQWMRGEEEAEEVKFTCDATNKRCYKGSCQVQFAKWMMNDSWSTGHFTLALLFL